VCGPKVAPSELLTEGVMGAEVCECGWGGGRGGTGVCHLGTPAVPCTEGTQPDTLVTETSLLGRECRRIPQLAFGQTEEQVSH